MSNVRYLNPKVSGPMLSFKDGGKVRWKCVWLASGATAIASEWVPDDYFGNAWVQRMIAAVQAERKAAGLPL
jgi:hypothetical protein